MQTSQNLENLFSDLPLDELLDKDLDDMSADELRAFQKVLDRRRSSPGEKRASKGKDSAKLKNPKKLDFDHLMG